MDIFTNQALKANRGDQNWQRFFALMGSAIAYRERSPLVPGTPETRAEFLDELRHYVQLLDVLNVMPAFGSAIRLAHHMAAKNARYYLLHLSFSAKTIKWYTFAWNESQAANAAYTRLEQENADSVGEYFVLVKPDSLSAMKRAYPSFFLDTNIFARLVTEAVSDSGVSK